MTLPTCPRYRRKEVMPENGIMEYLLIHKKIHNKNDENKDYPFVNTEKRSEWFRKAISTPA